MNFSEEEIRKAREIEAGLLREIWLSSQYNLLPQLERLNRPVLVLHGERDFIPLACSAHIAWAVLDARLVVFNECGHFSFIEAAEEVYQVVAEFLGKPPPL